MFSKKFTVYINLKPILKNLIGSTIFVFLSLKKKTLRKI
jgi:hypothetical protein